jgi:hypothetical protein
MLPQEPYGARVMLCFLARKVILDANLTHLILIAMNFWVP